VNTEAMLPAQKHPTAVNCTFERFEMFTAEMEA
jgi:hypothetical protein